MYRQTMLAESTNDIESRQPDQINVRVADRAYSPKAPHRPGWHRTGRRDTLGQSRAEQVVQLADQVQQWAVEALWSAKYFGGVARVPGAPWFAPAGCRGADGQAVWSCPEIGTVVAAIGEL